MFNIKMLATEPDERAAFIKVVATIETIVQIQEAWTYQTLTDLLEQESISLMVVIDTAEDEVVGYCLYQVVFEQAEILRIGTHPQYQRRGVASKIFAALKKELQNNEVESLLLEVRADNTPAIALYEQQGFEVIHRRQGYYHQPYQPAIDALIMQRSFLEE